MSPFKQWLTAIQLWVNYWTSFVNQILNLTMNFSGFLQEILFEISTAKDTVSLSTD